MNQTIFVPNDDQSQTAAMIEAWLISQFAERLEIESDEIDVHEPFDNYNLDSAQTMLLLGRLEKWLGHIFNPTLLFNYPTIAELAQRLAEETK